MSLKLALLKNVKHRPGKILAQCPACAEVGGDSKSIHLVVYPDGKFGCSANPKDRAHRRRIAELVGDPERRVKPWTLKLRGKAVMAGAQQPTPTPITSLSRNSVQGVNASNNAPSEVSGKTFSDKTDAYKDSTHCTAKFDQICTAVHKGLLRHPSEVSENAVTSDPSEVSVSSIATNPCEPSEDIVAKALSLFEGKVVAVIAPDGIVPGRFRDVLVTWSSTRNHPGLQDYTPKKLCGWTRGGSPVYCK
jgi:hypothetical protein